MIIASTSSRQPTTSTLAPHPMKLGICIYGVAKASKLSLDGVKCAPRGGPFIPMISMGSKYGFYVFEKFHSTYFRFKYPGKTL